MRKYKIFTVASIIMILTGLGIGASSMGLVPDPGLASMTDRVSETIPEEGDQTGNSTAASPEQYQTEDDPQEQAPRAGGAPQDRTQDAAPQRSEDGPRGENREITQERARAESGSQKPRPPEDKSLTLDVPKMELSDVNVQTGAANDEAALKQGALRVQGTGLPWQVGSNTYIAGHRVGYPMTDSWRVFQDLPSLQKGDEVTLTDAKGTEYTYSVFKKQNPVDPQDMSSLEPVPGKSVVTLQTCTFPNFTERIVVQAELTEVDKK